MQKFTVAEMLDELRAILLFEADHVSLSFGPQAAEQLIGLKSDGGDYQDKDVKDVDLDRSHIAGAFERAYEFAFRPSVTNNVGTNDIEELNLFMLGTPRGGSGGETHRFMTPDGLCQTVADAATARWKLEWDIAGSGTHTFTTRELALLADMTEGAVRNALADKSESGLRAIPDKRNPIVVTHAEALRWLKGRRGFVSLPDSPRADRFFLEQLRNIHSSHGLGNLILERVVATFSSAPEAAHAIHWSISDLADWLLGNQTFELKRARTLAEALDLDVPLFAGKALEVVLRRDSEGAAAVK